MQRLTESQKILQRMKANPDMPRAFRSPCEDVIRQTLERELQRENRETVLWQQQMQEQSAGWRRPE